MHKKDKFKDDRYKNKKRLYEIESKVRNKSKQARLQANTTVYQRDAYEKLKEKGFDVIIEKPITYGHSFFLIDLYLPEYRMCIEIDGNSHDTEKQIQKDARRDKYLKENGYWVIRVKNEHVKSGFIQRVKNSIKFRNHVEGKYGLGAKNLRN